MIIRDRPRIWDLAFALRGSVVPLILPNLLVLMGLATVMVLADHLLHLPPLADGTPFTVFGIALSLFLGFRNNAAYDRWWEARKLWGGLLADLRSLARELQVFVRDTALTHAILHDALVFVHLHRAQLRGLARDPVAVSLAGDLASAAHPPCAALDQINARVAAAHVAGAMDGFGARALTTRLASIALQQAGCERIAATPLPYVYSLLIYRTTYIYCMLLPLALVQTTGWLTPLFVGIVAYVFLGLAEVTEELSHPFGATLNGLPLDAICRSVEISFAPHLGEAPPPPMTAQNFFLG